MAMQSRIFQTFSGMRQDKNDYISYIFDEAKHTQNIKKEDLGEDPHLLLLSTCTYEFEDARGILVGIID